MAQIRSFRSDYYQIPLEKTLTNSMHRDMQDFELNTVRIQDDEGLEGISYIFTEKHRGKAEDLKGPVVFLSSRASDYESGKILMRDGGWMGR